MRSYLVVALAGILAGCASIETKTELFEYGNATPIRVMTFNILRDEWAAKGHLSWKERGTSVTAVLRDHEPDMVGLQEETADQVAFICNALDTYSYLGAHHRNGGGLLIRTDAWHIIDNGKIDIPDNRQASWASLASAQTSQRWMVYNVHFKHDSASKRLEAAKMIAEHIARNTPRDTPVVLLGDFNARNEDPPMRHLGGEAGSPIRLVNAFNRIHGNEDPRGTVGGLKRWRHGPRIDHILVNECVTVLSANILYDRLPNAYPSDHYPVKATLSAMHSIGIKEPNKAIEGIAE